MIRNPNRLAYEALRSSESVAAAEDTYRRMKASRCHRIDTCALDDDCPFIDDCRAADAGISRSDPGLAAG